MNSHRKTHIAATAFAITTLIAACANLGRFIPDDATTGAATGTTRLPPEARATTPKLAK